MAFANIVLSENIHDCEVLRLFATKEQKLNILENKRKNVLHKIIFLE